MIFERNLAEASVALQLIEFPPQAEVTKLESTRLRTSFSELEWRVATFPLSFEGFGCGNLFELHTVCDGWA